MNKQKLIDKIVFHLSINKDSFLYALHEIFDVDKVKYNELILNIKKLKSEWIQELNKDFIYAIINGLSYMFHVLRETYQSNSIH